jgi:hypothetical protein
LHITMLFLRSLIRRQPEFRIVSFPEVLGR